MDENLSQVGSLINQLHEASTQSGILSGKLGVMLEKVLPPDSPMDKSPEVAKDDYVPLARDLDEILADVLTANHYIRYILESLQL